MRGGGQKRGCQRTWDTASTHAFATRGAAGSGALARGSLTCPGPSRWELALEGRGGIALAPRSAGRARRPAQAARRPPAHCSLSPEGLRPWLLVA